MRIAYAILLTALILINLFGFYTLFIFRQAEIKTEMSEIIGQRGSTGHTETLTFDKAAFAQLSFNDNGKEFRYDGKLYDVVSIQHTGSHVNIIVEYDLKETALVDAFGAILGQQQDKDQSSSPLKTIISHFQQDYVASYDYFNTFVSTITTGYNLINRSHPSSSFVADNLTPPPQFFLV